MTAQTILSDLNGPMADTTSVDRYLGQTGYGYSNTYGLPEATDAAVQGLEQKVVLIKPSRGMYRAFRWFVTHGYRIATLSTHPFERQEAEAKQLGIDSLISGYNVAFPKDVACFLRTASSLAEKGSRIGAFVDDNTDNLYHALLASKILKSASGKGFDLYYFKRNATDDELGQTDGGIVIVNSLRQVGEWRVRRKQSSLRLKHKGIKEQDALERKSRKVVSLSKERAKRRRK